eukprot:2669121-Rhodomonas_salina.3
MHIVLQLDRSVVSSARHPPPCGAISSSSSVPNHSGFLKPRAGTLSSLNSSARPIHACLKFRAPAARSARPPHADVTPDLVVGAAGFGRRMAWLLQ